MLSAASAEENFEQLQNCMQGSSSYGIIVPQAHFLEQLLRFYPKLPRERFYTPSTLLKTCGLRPVSIEIACLEEDFDIFRDPSLTDFKDKTLDAWLKQQPYASWNDASEVAQTPFERCVLSGSFSENERRKTLSFLQSRCREIFVLQRTFPKKASVQPTKNMHLHPHRSPAEGYAWTERMKAEYPNLFGILLPSAETLKTLFQKPPSQRALAWLDWQEAGTVSAFLAYIRTQAELETLKRYQKDCDAAVRACRTERFEVLREYLIREGKVWIEEFVRCDWENAASVGTYISLLQDVEPPFECVNFSVLQACPLTIAKRAFFDFLRRVFQFQAGFESHILPWNEALYLPVKEGFAPQAIAANSARDTDILQWFAEVTQRGGVLHLGVPLRDKNGEPLQPLTGNLSEAVGTNNTCVSATGGGGVQEPSTETATDNGRIETTTDGRMYITVSNALSMTAVRDMQRPKANILRFPSSEKNETLPNGDVFLPSGNALFPAKNTLHIPTELIRFSCKDWERFYLCPRKTWLEKILKTTSVSLHPIASKALFWGESIHDNLLFQQPPHDLGTWRKLIRQRSEVRWEQLCRYHPKTSLLYHRHQRALEFSLKMAKACEEFLHDDWHLYSEYILPKESLYTGRIDLLAVHAKQQKVVIVDYKSGSNETFTQRTLQSGHGWQLLLYGDALQKLYPTYAVELRMILRTGKLMPLPLDKLHGELSEMNVWVETFRQSGIYENLPNEKSETLPLAFCDRKSARF